MVSAEEMNLLPKNASKNGVISAQNLFTLVQDHLAMLKFLWLCNHHSISMYRVWLSVYTMYFKTW